MNIILCDGCKGEGEYLSYIKNDNNPEMVLCDRCNGTGREYIRHYTLRIPFGSDHLKINELDSKIMILIRDKDKF